MDELHLKKLDTLQQNLEPEEKGEITWFTQKMKVKQLGKQKTRNHQEKQKVIFQRSQISYLFRISKPEAQMTEV